MANFRKPKLPSLPVFVAVMIVLLAVLGTLQYRWLGRVSRGEREAMEASLRSRTRSFCEEFDREITRAYTLLRIDAVTLRDKTRAGYADRFAKWRKTAKSPRIVKDVLLAEADEAGRLHLYRFEEEAKTFAPIAWPPDFEILRQRMEPSSSSGAAPANPFAGGTDAVVEEIPALVSTIAAVKVVDASRDHQVVDWQRPLGYAVITLDLPYIKSDVIPALARDYFSSGDKAEYDLTILRRGEPHNVIYQSRPGPADNDPASVADASDRLLNIGFNSVKRFSSERVYDTTNPSKRGNGGGVTMVIPALEDGGEDNARILLVDDGGRWEVRVNHRAGSLDAAVASARRWNLAVSMGILLLLGISMTMIAVLSRRAERLGRRQVEFVAGVSHEFRTPLAVIYSLSENLAAGRIHTAEQVQRYGEAIRKDVRRLTEMVEQVLVFAGVNRGAYFYDKSPLDVGELLEKILAANASLFQEGDWRIENEVEPGLPLVLADAAALTRAIQNLLSNAVKYGGDNRWLKVKALLQERAQRPEVEIVVEDRGSGIAAADLPHIFEPFYRGQEAVNAQIHGNGLGLNIVKQIIEAHGGRVSVASSPGRGSRFTLHLPVSELNG